MRTLTGNPLEVVVMTVADGTKLATHAMAMRRRTANFSVMTDPRRHGHTKSGRVITQAEVTRPAAEAGAGYDVDELIARRLKRCRPAIGSSAATG